MRCEERTLTCANAPNLVLTRDAELLAADEIGARGVRHSLARLEQAVALADLLQADVACVFIVRWIALLGARASALVLVEASRLADAHCHLCSQIGQRDRG